VVADRLLQPVPHGRERLERTGVLTALRRRVQHVADRRQFPQFGNGAEERDAIGDPLGFVRQFIGGGLARVEQLAVDAIIGAVRVHHSLVGCAEQALLGFVFVCGVGIRRAVWRPFHGGQQREAGRAPVLVGVGLEVLEELAHQLPGRLRPGSRVVGRLGLVQEFEQPLLGQLMERAGALFQGHTLRLAEPVDQQGHGGDEVVAFQQRLDDQREGLGRVEHVGIPRPEPDIAGLGAPFVPQVEALRHVLRRAKDLLRVHRVDAGDFVRRELPPPGGRGLELAPHLLAQPLLVFRCRRAPDPRKQAEDLLHQRDQLVGAMVVHAVLERREEAEVRIEPQQVPGVDDRAARNRAMQQVDDAPRQRHGARQVAGQDRLVPRGQPAVDLAQHARRGDGDDARLARGRVRVPHASEDFREMHVFQLARATARQPGVEMLAGAAKRLTPRPRFLLQPLAVRRRRQAYQLLVKRVPIRGYRGQQT